MRSPALILITACCLAMLPGALPAQSSDDRLVIAGIDAGVAQENASAAKKKLSPEERMAARFPQPVLAGFLVGLPVLDWDDSTIGYVQQVVRSPDGKIKLIVPYGRWFGWLRWSLFDKERRLVAVPIEVVAILGRQIASFDMEPSEYAAAPTWTATEDRPIPADETIRIAIANR